MTLYLSRLTVARTPSIQALTGLLDPTGARQLDAHHKLIWSAFAEDPNASRDFLWRAEGAGVFLVLSHRRPACSPVFEPPQVREFAPDLRMGDRLGFVLRANATQTRKTGEVSSGGKEKKRHVDLVMDALYPLAEGRAAARMDAAQTVGETWLAGQGKRHGFRHETVAVEDYSVHRFRRDRAVVTFGMIDIRGILIVTEPDRLLSAIAQGLGRAKAFGGGLMLLRRS